MTFAHVVELIIAYRYWIIIPLSFVEGPIIAFIVGALSFLGYFNPLGMFTFLLGRDIALDSLMYAIGRFGGQTKFAQRVLAKIKFTDSYLEEIRVLWDTHGLRTMFLSKLSYGLSAAFLIVAGIVRMPFSHFFRYGALVAILQYGALFIIGYIVGSKFNSFGNIINDALFAIAIISLFIVGYYIFAHKVKDKLLEEEQHALDK